MRYCNDLKDIMGLFRLVRKYCLLQKILQARLPVDLWTHRIWLAFSVAGYACDSYSLRSVYVQPYLLSLLNSAPYRSVHVYVRWRKFIELIIPPRRHAGGRPVLKEWVKLRNLKTHQAKVSVRGLGCGQGWTPALFVTHTAVKAAYAALYKCRTFSLYANVVRENNDNEHSLFVKRQN